MKKALLTLTALLAILGIGYGSYAATSELVKPDATVQEAEVTTQPAADTSQLAEQAIDDPVLLEIPKINVETKIEHVGLDAEKRMDVPKEWENVAWFELGPEPGEFGSAVIAGHLDSPTGPAVFYELDSLTAGDEVIVKGEDGSSLTFVVEKTATYSDNNFPLQEVFDRKDGNRLNLITCSGTFNQSTQIYSHRLVVYTILKE